MCSFYFSSKVCNTPSLLVYFLWFLALRGKTLNHTAHWLLQNASSPDNEGVSEIWIAYKPRAVVVWAWWVKGVSSEMNTVKGGLREATAPLAFGLTMIHEDGCLRICADHMKGSDSGWAGKWLLLGLLGKALMRRVQYSFWSFLKRVLANLVLPKFSQGQTPSALVGSLWRLGYKGSASWGGCQTPPSVSSNTGSPISLKKKFEEAIHSLSLMFLLEQFLKDNSVQ